MVSLEKKGLFIKICYGFDAFVPILHSLQNIHHSCGIRLSFHQGYPGNTQFFQRDIVKLPIFIVQRSLGRVRNAFFAEEEPAKRAKSVDFRAFPLKKHKKIDKIKIKTSRLKENKEKISLLNPEKPQ